MTFVAVPLFRATDPDTSRIAAASTDRTCVRTLVAAILAAHPEGLTDHELWELTGLGWEQKGSVIRRRAECGAVDSLERRSSPSGRPCVVWVLGGAS